MSTKLEVQSYQPMSVGSIYSGNSHPGAVGEVYVSRERLATIMGVSIGTIDRFVGLGMPSETWGLHVRRFLPSQAIAWAACYAAVSQ